jgi:hypothetical protein
MKMTRLALLASLPLFAACPHRIVLPDDRQAHQLARDADVEVWCHGPEAGSWTKCKVQAQKGWWLAPPSIADRPQ